jgi:putative transposase
MRNSDRRRRSLRLRGYDYGAAGAYFVTICTQDRACLFGEVIGGSMRPNDAGRMVAARWSGLPARFAGVEIDMFVVMPNHLHGIVVLRDDGTATTGAPTRGATTRVAPTGRDSSVGAPLVGAPSDVPARIRLGAIVGAFKSITTVDYIRGVGECGWPAFRGRLWQRNYHEHVVRDEASLNRIRRYIDENPLRWGFDDENPDRGIA